jgi:hypothetical protein
MRPIYIDGRGGGGSVLEEAYLEWSSHNSTSVAGGLQVGERGMLFITFCLGKGGKMIHQDGENNL